MLLDLDWHFGDTPQNGRFHRDISWLCIMVYLHNISAIGTLWSFNIAIENDHL